MIKLKPFQLTPHTYYRIIVRQRLRKSGWLYLLCLGFSIYTLFSPDRSSLAVFIIVFGLIYIPLMLVYYYFWATSYKNDSLFLERETNLEDEKMSVTSGDMYSELPYKHVQKVIETSDYLLLYIAKSQFIYLPKSAFVESRDIESLKNLIKLQH